MILRKDLGTRVAGQKATMLDEFVTLGQLNSSLPLSLIINEDTNDIYVTLKIKGGLTTDTEGNLTIKVNQLQNLLKINENNELEINLPNNSSLYLNGTGQWTPIIGSDVAYIYEQQVPSLQWTINHNLGKYASVSVVDYGNNIVQCNIEYINENQIKLYFNYPTSGRAYLN